MSNGTFFSIPRDKCMCVNNIVSSFAIQKCVLAKQKKKKNSISSYLKYSNENSPLICYIQCLILRYQNVSQFIYDSFILAGA